MSGDALCWTDMDCIERVKVAMAKIEKIKKLAQNRSKQFFKSLFKPKLDFKPYLLNPFNIEHWEETSVKCSILRVVML